MARKIIRRLPRSSGSLTAAASRIQGDATKAFKSPSVGRNGDWQAQAWEFLRRVGEFQYYVGWRASSASQCRLVASEFDEDGMPTGQVSPENARVAQIVRDIAGGVTGQSQLIQRLTVYLTVPGEGWTAMIVRDPTREETADRSPVALGAAQEGEQWLAVSRKEVTTKGTELLVTLPDGVRHTYNPETDLMFRIWNPDPEIASNATSTAQAASEILAEIVRTSATIDAAAKSRLIGNGIVFVPQEMSLPKVRPVNAPQMPNDPAPGPAVPVYEQADAQDLQDLIAEVATTAMKDPHSLAALLPIFATGPGEWIKNVTHLKFDSTVSETALKTREAAIRRLATSLDVSPERLLGIGNNSNHWTAWAIAEDDVKIHVAPVLKTIAQAFTQEVLRPALLAEGFDPDQFCIWYDTSSLTQDPDKKDEAKDASDRGALTNAALLDALGFSETDGYDLTTLLGWQQLARDRAAKDPTLIPMLAPLLSSDVAAIMAAPAQPALPASPPPKTVEPDADPVDDAPEEPTSTEPPEESVSASVVSSTLIRLGINRALEMANKRRRNRTNHAALSTVPIYAAHVAHLPAAADMTEVTKLVDGWDASITNDTIDALGMDPDTYRRVVLAKAGHCLMRGELP